MKTNTKKMIRLAAILYCVLLVVVLISTLAWFVLDKTAGIESENNMKITVGEGLEISLDGTNWGQLQKPNISYSCPDITGDGVNFYYPQTLDKNDNPIYNDPSSFLNINTDEDREKFYVDVVLHFRTSGSSAVYLTNNSLVDGVDLGTPDAMVGEVPNDAIAGAVRVAFYDITTMPAINEMTGEEYASALETALKCIWIPNEKYQISSGTTTNGDGETVETFTFNKTGAPEDSYGYLAPNANASEYAYKEWTTEEYASGKVIVGTDRLATYTSTASATYLAINNAMPLLDFSDNTDVMVKTMLIRIWVEGTDREAHTYLNSGEVKYKFEFVNINKSATTEDDNTKLSGIKYDATNKKLLYSDNTEVAANEVLYSYDGIAWNSYTPSISNDGGFNPTHTNANGDKVIFIKLAETKEKRPSQYKEVPITTAGS